MKIVISLINIVKFLSQSPRYVYQTNIFFILTKLLVNKKYLIFLITNTLFTVIFWDNLKNKFFIHFLFYIFYFFWKINKLVFECLQCIYLYLWTAHFQILFIAAWNFDCKHLHFMLILYKYLKKKKVAIYKAFVINLSYFLDIISSYIRFLYTQSNSNDIINI